MILPKNVYLRKDMIFVMGQGKLSARSSYDFFKTVLIQLTNRKVLTLFPNSYKQATEAGFSSRNFESFE